MLHTMSDRCVAKACVLRHSCNSLFAFMSQASTSIDQNGAFPLSLWYSLEANGNIFDFSGNTPFNIYVCVSRKNSRHAIDLVKHVQPIDVLADSTCFDISGALTNGLMSLVENRNQCVERDYESCNTTLLPCDLFMHDDFIQMPRQRVVRLAPARLHPIYHPQRIECTLDPTIVSKLRDGAIYSIAFPPEARKGGWNGGIECWNIPEDRAATPNFSTLSRGSEARVR